MIRMVTAISISLATLHSAAAVPITLVCTGTISFPGHDAQAITRETAVLDLEARSFKPPLYPAFTVTRIGETDVSFGSETSTHSTWGSLDRVSGTMTLNVFNPTERKKLQAGGSANYMAWLSAKCSPAQRMF